MIKQKDQELAQVQTFHSKKSRPLRSCVQMIPEYFFLSIGKILCPFTLLSPEPNKKTDLSDIHWTIEKVGTKSTAIKALVNEEMLDTVMLAVLRDGLILLLYVIWKQKAMSNK